MATVWRNALGALAVLGGLVLLVVAPAVAATRLPDEQAPPPGRLDVGYGVTLRTPGGARLDVGPSRPGSGEVRLRVAGAVVSLEAVEVRGSRSRYVAHARHKLARDGQLLPGPAGPATTAAGVRGEQGPLLGGERRRSGCYAIFSARSAGVVITVTRVPDCERMPESVRDAVASVTFDKAGAL